MRHNISDYSSTTPSPPSHGATGLPYVAGLDGLRALAVIAVLLYHAGLPVWGGFLGVESFFTLSGYLITSLLLLEWRREGHVDLAAFWIRRARRLLPALFFLLAGTILLAMVALRGQRMELGQDISAALGYMMNWRLISTGQSYFDPLARAPLLQHLWSLAVEEQFYLLWPVLFALGMRRFRARGLLIATLVVAVASALLMAWLYRPGADPSRIYYGTDTRVAGLLIGAALAMAWTRDPMRAAPRALPGRLLDGAGLLALGGLLVCYLLLSERHPLLYRGGFVLVATLTAVVIAALTHPYARLAPSLLGWGPLRWIGLRSYGIYLWHWPVFTVTRPFIDVPLDGLPLLLFRLALVGALVELSYHYVEMPIRRGAVERLWNRLVGEAKRGALSAMRAPSPVRDIRWPVVLLGVLCMFSLGVRSSLPFPSLSGETRLAAPASARLDIPSLATTVAESRLVEEAPTPALPAPSPTAEAPIVVASAFEPTSPPRVLARHVADPAMLEPVVPSEPRVEPEPTVAPTQTPVPTPTSGPSQPADPALVAELQHLLDDTVADGYIPGVVLSVSIPGYEPWTGASGWANPRRGEPIRPGTLVHIASVTKMFTAVVVLQLVEEGKIELNAPIATWLPDIVPYAESTTVRHLLSHRSGIFDYVEDSRFFAAAYRNPDRVWTPEELVGTVDDFGTAFVPGAKGQWKYASTNYVILGMLVEQVTGRSLAEEVRHRIVEPLGLTHTYFAPDEPPQEAVAQGHIYESDRSDVSMTFVYATGNIISTADEMRQFAEALFAGRLLRPEALAAMQKLVDTGGAYDMPELEYGLGLMGARLNVGPGPDGQERPLSRGVVLGHIGGIAGTRAAVWRVPESGVTIALGINQSDADPNLLARDVLEVILTWQGR